MRYIKILIIIIIVLTIIVIIFNNTKQNENTNDFKNNPVFVPLYDNNKEQINVMLISKPFPTKKDYKIYKRNKDKYIFIGITSYMEFPKMPSNPIDNFKIEKFNNHNSYDIKMYQNICEGWLHCFRNPCDYIPCNLPYTLISESDFIDISYVKLNAVKEYDFLYNCPKVNKDSGCNDWVSYNKNWELAKKCLPILCEKYQLKGLLIGRDGCDIPEGCKQYITTTGWVEYEAVLELYKKCKFLFLPNIIDASPRIITECMTLNLPCIMNYNILGGWKYLNEKTGVFFKDETDFEKSLTDLLNNFYNYKPREYILSNFGPINSGKRLKQFLFENFKDKLNIKDAEYISIRHPI